MASLASPSATLSAGPGREVSPTRDTNSVARGALEQGDNPPTTHSLQRENDGWRATVTVWDGQLVLRTRTGRDVTESAPELASIAGALAGRSVVLDGELVAHHGTPSTFYRLSGRMAARRSATPAAHTKQTPLTFVAFDVLYLDGEDVTRERYRDR